MSETEDDISLRCDSCKCEFTVYYGSGNEKFYCPVCCEQVSI